MKLADWRRSKLTLLGVLADKDAEQHPLSMCHFLFVLLMAIAYTFLLLPKISSLGNSFDSVGWAYISVLSIAYVGLAFVGMHYMQRRHSPVQGWVFECMLVHNATQCLLNVFCFSALVIYMPIVAVDGFSLRSSPEEGWTDGVKRLIWLQYHCRQLQLMDTVFMILRKKFEGISLMHLYLRVLHLWGWFIAYRFAASSVTYFPALVSSACQGIVYGLYFCSTLEHRGNQSKVMARTARVAEVTIFQYVVCALHSAAASIWGDFPRILAALHLFAIGNGILLYTDFHSEQARTHDRNPRASEDTNTTPDAQEDASSQPSRVVFSFDSCGWLMVYHFGVAAWLYEHLNLNDDEGQKRVGFSGSSGGSLIACVLAAGVSPKTVFEDILGELPACRQNPREMFPAVERALRKHVYPGAHKRVGRRLRVLLTRVAAQPPFLMGEVMEDFPDNETAIEALCASCHVPVLAGVLPRRVGKHYYYDGLAWASRFFVPWRGAKGDHVIRVSASGTPFSDITIPEMPRWWGGLPPNQEVLCGLFWIGYRDASNWFATKPQLLPACCNSRQSEYTNTTLPSNDLARWHAARALLKKQTIDNTMLPTEGVRLGASVHEQIQVAEDKAFHECRSSKRVIAGFVVAAVATSVTYLAPTSQMLWGVFGVPLSAG
mmetsp:Transcript_85676/g.141932  ORF Transcript_85676/g.141932 Transcript_85676/m.141932 type:complete len:659 (-) Transcript_85676:227-2203(-)